MYTLKLDWSPERIAAVTRALESAYYPARTRMALDSAEQAHVGAALYDLSVCADSRENGSESRKAKP